MDGYIFNLKRWLHALAKIERSFIPSSHHSESPCLISLGGSRFHAWGGSLLYCCPNVGRVTVSWYRFIGNWNLVPHLPSAAMFSNSEVPYILLWVWAHVPLKILNSTWLINLPRSSCNWIWPRQGSSLGPEVPAPWRGTLACQPNSPTDPTVPSSSATQCSV